jgi:DNA-binding PadR family transcriptional regulator
MRSLVNWALLGLVIDRPSYAYELAQRFEREYRDALSLASVSHVYTALATLRRHGLIEEIAGTRGSRQPKPHYRATPEGIDAYRDWLVEQLVEERQRQRLLALQLGALTRSPQSGLEVLARYEQSCLALARREEPAVAEGSDVTARLLAEESRLSVGARLAWVHYARREFSALAERSPRAR